jgi:DNA-binding XRE family transcriptional regulator
MGKITLKAARVNAGYKQKEVSELLDISNKTICSWEKGKTVPKVDMVNKLCELYKVNYDDLIFLPSNPL